MTEFLLLTNLVVLLVLVFKWQQANQRIVHLSERLRVLETRRRDEPQRQPAAAPAPPVEAREADRSTAPSSMETPGVQPAPVPPPAASLPPSLPPVVPPTPAPLPADRKTPLRPLPKELVAINWENFLGVKLFAWVGGLALFLGVGFFVKYSFEQGLISPAMRVVIGFVTGLGLIVGGLMIPRKRHAVTVQTLCASGVLILYATLFAAHSFYRFIGPTTAFIAMALVTGAAFSLSIRLNAQAVAVLALVGGFLTPPLLSTGVDRPFALFGYISLLDLGLIAVALKRKWTHLTGLGTIGTVLMQFGWVFEFFEVDKLWTGFSIFLGFSLLFVCLLFLARRSKVVDKWICFSSLLMPASGFLFALYLLQFHGAIVATHAPAFFTYLFLVDVGLLVMAALRDELRAGQAVGGMVVFFILTVWTLRHLSDALQNVGLGCYLIFSVMHAAFPVVLQRFRPGSVWLKGSQFYPVAALLLVLVPIFQLTKLSVLLWPVVLLIDLAAVSLAIASSSLVAILAVFLVTVAASALWIARPATLTDVPGMLGLVGGFALFFMGAAFLASRRVKRLDGSGPRLFDQSLALGAIMPFLLLTLMVVRLPLADPSALFGLAGALCVLLLLLARYCGAGLLAPTALAAVLLPEFAWFTGHFSPAQGALALAWFGGFAVLFLVFPFLFQKRLQTQTLPWAASALALPAHYWLLHYALKQTFPNRVMGLLPALLAIPCLVALLRLRRSLDAGNPARNGLLALYGGAVLCFVTLIFPVQFDRQWITLGWALEGVALVWLFHRIPHPGLRLAGTVLLGVSFIRLALNPEVLHYKTRLSRSIFNWYLYTYSIVSSCLFAAGRLLAAPRHLIGTFNVPPFLHGTGAVLAFLLLNIEIANYFSAGERLTFRGSGNLGQDMTYSLGWALFASALLAVGFKVNSAPTRYCGMGLLVVTLLKLFLYDLWQLGGLYRIGSLVGLAIVLILVSFGYQRFLSSPREGGGGRGGSG